MSNKTYKSLEVLLIILFVTILLFIWGKLSPDIVALLSMLSLNVFGILDLQDTFSGFSNSTVIMIAALFIIGEGLSNTGWTAYLGQKFVQWAGKSKLKLLSLLSLGSGFLSGFVSNTGTVATLLPVTVTAAYSLGTLPSKMLIPVAFSSNTGGLITLTGTPPNIIANNTLIQSDLDGFSFFEFALIGVPLLLASLLFYLYKGFQLLPNNKPENEPINLDSEMTEWIESYSIDKHIYRLRIRSMSPLINTKIQDWSFEKNHKISIIRLKRRHPKKHPNPKKSIKTFVEFPTPDVELRYHDIITVKGETKDVDAFVRKYFLGILPFQNESDNLKEEFINQEVGMAEMMVTPKSILLEQEVSMGNYIEHLGVQLISASRNNKALTSKVVRIKAGDAFIIRGTWARIEKLKKLYKNLVISGSPEVLSKNVDTLTTKSYISLTVLLFMVLFLIFNILPGAITTMFCAGILILTNCVPIAKVYKGISWVSVVMIAAMIPMGIALQKTGTAELIATTLVDCLGNVHPLLLLSGIFLLTTTFSQAINNSATAVLMAPIALLAANSLGVSPKPFMITIAISASTAFLTPVGTTTNAMIMSAGNYSFKDYIKVGAPLLLIYFVISMLLIPLIWPF